MFNKALRYYGKLWCCSVTFLVGYLQNRSQNINNSGADVSPKTSNHFGRNPRPIDASQ